MKLKFWIAVLLVAVLLPILWWIKWTRGHDVVRSRHEYHTVIIHKAPQRRFWFNLIDYLVDVGEVRSTQVYSFRVYSNSQASPITSFSTTDIAFDPWKTAAVKWLGPRHFIIILNNIDTYECKFGTVKGVATWRHL